MWGIEFNVAVEHGINVRSEGLGVAEPHVIFVENVGCGVWQSYMQFM